MHTSGKDMTFEVCRVFHLFKLGLDLAKISTSPVRKKILLHAVAIVCYSPNNCTIPDRPTSVGCL